MTSPTFRATFTAPDPQALVASLIDAVPYARDRPTEARRGLVKIPVPAGE